MLPTKPVPFTRLLPNIVTLIGLIIGVSSIRFALDSRWETAVYCTLIATIIDGVDGRVARMFNATSHFGAELDSLCDFVNFGLCPAILLYLWSFQQYEYKVISWASIMLFVVCMAIRLARFNTALVAPKDGRFLSKLAPVRQVQGVHGAQNRNVLNVHEDSSTGTTPQLSTGVEFQKKSANDNRFFTGVPAPCGALLALIPMILDFEFTLLIDNFSIRNYTLGINLYIVIIALLLPSRLATISLKGFHIKPEYLSLSMIISAVIIICAVIYPWYALPIAAILYMLSIPICAYIVHKS